MGARRLPGDTRGYMRRGAWAAGRFASNGDAQAGEFVLRRQTTDATGAALTADGGAAGTANLVNLPNNGTYCARHDGGRAADRRQTGTAGRQRGLVRDLPVQARRRFAATPWSAHPSAGSPAPALSPPTGFNDTAGRGAPGASPSPPTPPMAASPSPCTGEASKIDQLGRPDPLGRSRRLIPIHHGEFSMAL